MLKKAQNDAAVKDDIVAQTIVDVTAAEICKRTDTSNFAEFLVAFEADPAAVRIKMGVDLKLGPIDLTTKEEEGCCVLQ